MITRCAYGLGKFKNTSHFFCGAQFNPPFSARSQGNHLRSLNDGGGSNGDNRTQVGLNRYISETIEDSHKQQQTHTPATCRLLAQATNF